MKRGPGGQTLLKGTDKILTMLKSIPGNLESQISPIYTYSATAGFITNQITESIL